MSSATFYTGDVLQVLAKLPEASVDLVLTSPPFLALRSYLPADHPDKTLEGGSQSTPGEFVDWLLDVVEACDRVLAPHGSMVFELGDTFAGSGGAGGDYDEDGLREGQPNSTDRRKRGIGVATTSMSQRHEHRRHRHKVQRRQRLACRQVAGAHPRDVPVRPRLRIQPAHRTHHHPVAYPQRDPLGATQPAGRGVG